MSGYSPGFMVKPSVLEAVPGALSFGVRPPGLVPTALGAILNSVGVLSDVLSTVCDLPCDRGGVCICVVGWENTLLGGLCRHGEPSNPLAADIRFLSIEARGGGGGIETRALALSTTI